METSARKPHVAGKRTVTCTRCRIQRLPGSAHAHPELYAHHYRQFRPAVLPERHGRTHARAVGRGFHRIAVRLHHRSPDVDARTLQLSVGTQSQNRWTA